MQAVRDDVVSVLASFVPDLADRHVIALESSIFNATVRAQTEAGLDATWGEVFVSEYKRLAAAIAANLTQEAGFSNGNTELLQRIMRGDIDVAAVAAMSPSSVRPSTFTDLDTPTERLSKATLRKSGTMSSMFTCPKCAGSSCSYTELQTRSADEGTTIFLFCHTCSTQWTEGG
jgi:DNA-directed RNA polymerase subunit M/transcription elongation factor TFIIS